MKEAIEQLKIKYKAEQGDAKAVERADTKSAKQTKDKQALKNVTAKHKALRHVAAARNKVLHSLFFQRWPCFLFFRGI